MKKTFALFTLCLVLILGIVAVAAFTLHHDRDQVSVTAETLAGDPAQAAGLTAKQSAQYDGRLYWNLTIPLDRPEDTETVFSSHQSLNQGRPGTPSIYLSVPTDGTYLLYSPYDLEAVANCNPGMPSILPLLQEVVDRTPDGQQHAETLVLADYMDVYPLNVEVTAPYTTSRSGDYDLSPVWQAFFSFPIPEEETWTITARKDSQGNLLELSMACSAPSYSPNVLTAYTGDRLFFTLDGNSSGACVNTPGGFGIYSPALVWQDGDPYLELDVLSNVFPLPQGTQVLNLSPSRDGKDLLLTTRLGEVCTLRVIDPETMAVEQSLTIPDENLTGSLLEETCLLLWSDTQLHLYTQEAGAWTYRFSSPMNGFLLQGADQLTAAWNGERLALGTPLSSNSPGLVLAVYEAGTLTYLGTYATSRTEEDATPWPPSDPVCLVNGAELALAWE